MLIKLSFDIFVRPSSLVSFGVAEERLFAVGVLILFALACFANALALGGRGPAGLVLSRTGVRDLAGSVAIPLLRIDVLLEICGLLRGCNLLRGRVKRGSQGLQS